MGAFTFGVLAELPEPSSAVFECSIYNNWAYEGTGLPLAEAIWIRALEIGEVSTQG